MPFNAAVFKTRALTALLFVAVMGIGIFINKYLFATLFAVVTIGCLFEFFKLFPLIKSNRAFYTTYPLLIVLSFALLVYLHFTYGLVASGMCIFCMWLCDTAQYLVGSFLGKTPFFPSISPKKTWEGTIGGILLSVIMVFCAGKFWFTNAQGIFNQPIYWVLGPLVACIAGTIGDLYESKFKRLAGVKDSGSFMPGHGGFLDRFDSLILATPCVAFVVWLIIKLV
jgi:phosphatidate cytidylyltransferase